MGSSSAILDRQLSRTIAIETRKETSTVDETYENRPRIGAGSDISSTRGSGSPQGFVSSTPVETVETTSSPQSSTTSSPQSSDQSSEPSTTGEPKKGSEKTTASESPSSIADEYFESVTADDIQRILKERAIMRQLQPSTMDSSSVSSFVSATVATANEKSPQERTENVHQTKPSLSDEARKEHCIITLDPKAIAVIAGLMGSSSAILDRQLSRCIYSWS
ncbi:hypothetical protein COOONC_09740 [Cooperia oncophora]